MQATLESSAAAKNIISEISLENVRMTIIMGSKENTCGLTNWNGYISDYFSD